jgi:CHASE3 domain sensor protein
MDREVRMEIYLSLLLLGAEPMLLAAVASWRDGIDDKETLADLRNWNEAKLLELKEWLPTMTEAEVEAVQQRIRQYEEARQVLKQAA